jgi:hypothetical protein
VAKKTSEWKSLRHCISTWVSLPDYWLLSEMAEAEKVQISCYLRAIIIDVVAEEKERRSVVKTAHNNGIETTEQIELR